MVSATEFGCTPGVTFRDMLIVGGKGAVRILGDCGPTSARASGWLTRPLCSIASRIAGGSVGQASITR